MDHQLVSVPPVRHRSRKPQPVIPSGNWQVVEGCAVRYYRPVVGSLYATSPVHHRRVIFTAVSVVLPVFANWVRAWGIVMLGHFGDSGSPPVSITSLWLGVLQHHLAGSDRARWQETSARAGIVDRTPVKPYAAQIRRDSPSRCLPLA